MSADVRALVAHMNTAYEEQRKSLVVLDDMAGGRVKTEKVVNQIHQILVDMHITITKLVDVINAGVE